MADLQKIITCQKQEEETEINSKTNLKKNQYLALIHYETLFRCTVIQNRKDSLKSISHRAPHKKQLHKFLTVPENKSHVLL